MNECLHSRMLLVEAAAAKASFEKYTEAAERARIRRNAKSEGTRAAKKVASADLSMFGEEAFIEVDSHSTDAF
jgi:hypothetical protein